MKVKHKHALYAKGISTVQIAAYSNGRLAIRLMDEEGCPNAVASVNLPDEPCPEGCAYMKTYSENEGILEDLIEAGIVSLPIGYSSQLGAPLVRMTTPSVIQNN